MTLETRLAALATAIGTDVKALSQGVTGPAGPQGPAGPVGNASALARTTTSYTTGSLADGATETGLISIAPSYELLRIQTSAPARVRLYASTAQRDADAARLSTVDPTGDHGLLFEFVTTAGDLDWAIAPMVYGYRLDTISSSIPIAITNLSGSTAAVMVTLTYIPAEGTAGALQGPVGAQGPVAQPTIAVLSAVSSYTFSNLDGDTDIAYELLLEGVLSTGGSAKTITLRPNNVTTSTRQQGVTTQRDSAGAVTGNVASALTNDIGWRLGTDYGTANAGVSASARVYAQSGKSRQAIIDYAIKPAAQTTESQIGWRVYGSWADTATNLTSLVIDFNGGTFTGKAILRKLTEVGPQGPQGPTGPAATPSYVTSLPGSPVDGQEVYYRIADGVVWHLRYKASIGDGYKWEFIGGAELKSVGNYSNAFASAGSWQDGSQGAFSLTAPRPGIYDVEWGCGYAMVDSNQGYQVMMGVSYAGAAVVEPISSNYASSAYAQSSHRMSDRVTLTNATTSVALKQQVSSGGPTTSYIRNRYLALRPVRIS